MPMLCFAFYFENILIPVAKGFWKTDHQGTECRSSSKLALVTTSFYYILLLGMLVTIKHAYGEVYNDNDNPGDVYLVIFEIFHPYFGTGALLCMSLLAFIQSMCFFQMALEQLQIIYDQLVNSSVSTYVDKVMSAHNPPQEKDFRSGKNKNLLYWMPYMEMGNLPRYILGLSLYLFTVGILLVIENIDFIIDMLGSTTMPLIIMVIPGYFYSLHL